MARLTHLYPRYVVLCWFQVIVSNRTSLPPILRDCSVIDGSFGRPDAEPVTIDGSGVARTYGNKWCSRCFESSLNTDSEEGCSCVTETECDHKRSADLNCLAALRLYGDAVAVTDLAVRTAVLDDEPNCCDRDTTGTRCGRCFCEDRFEAHSSYIRKIEVSNQPVYPVASIIAIAISGVGAKLLRVKASGGAHAVSIGGGEPHFRQGVGTVLDGVIATEAMHGVYTIARDVSIAGGSVVANNSRSGESEPITERFCWRISRFAFAVRLWGGD